YSQPPRVGPIRNPKVVPDITRPMTRPRSSGPYRSAISAKPTTHVTASAAPCTSRAAKRAGNRSATANNRVEADRATSPPTSGPLRPTRSEIAPIGTDTARTVTPNDANRKPIIVAEAPRRRLRSGSTGTPIEYAMMSMSVAKVTSATVKDLAGRITELYVSYQLSAVSCQLSSFQNQTPKRRDRQGD